MAKDTKKIDASENRRQLLESENIRAFVLGDKAIFTVVDCESRKRYTYRVVRSDRDDAESPWFIEVLTGTDNTRDYSYVGCVFPSDRARYLHDIGSRVGVEAPSVNGFRWLLCQINNGGSHLDEIEFWHEGRCCMCGRTLTVPESIKNGVGSICMSKGM